MTAGKGEWLAPSSTPWDGADPGGLTPAEAMVMACHRDAYRYRHAPTSLEGEAEFFNGYARDSCPRCGSERIRGNGTDRNGVRRWRCDGCGRSFNPATGTIFDGRKIPVADWSEFLVGLLSFESVNALTRMNRRAGTTLPYWVAKAFAVLDGVQDGVVLSGRVELDEMTYPLALADQPRMPDGSLMRGAYSKSKMCIGLAVDGDGRSAFFWEGLGKTSGAKTWDAFGSHAERGSTLVHDKENGHNRLVRDLGLASEAHDSRALSGLPDGDNPLNAVNTLCFLLRTFLNSHSGFRRDDLQGWLNVFWVAMNGPETKMEKAAFVLDRAMANPKTLKYREFYSKSRSSSCCGASNNATICKG